MIDLTWYLILDTELKQRSSQIDSVLTISCQKMHTARSTPRSFKLPGNLLETDLSSPYQPFYWRMARSKVRNFFPIGQRMQIVGIKPHLLASTRSLFILYCYLFKGLVVWFTGYILIKLTLRYPCQQEENTVIHERVIKCDSFFRLKHSNPIYVCDLGKLQK